MDFTFSEEQQAVAEAAERHLLRAGRRPIGSRRWRPADDRFDRDLWARAGQGRPARPRRSRGDGGGGYGMVELCAGPRGPGSGRWRRCRCGPPWCSAALPGRRVRVRPTAGRAACPGWSPAIRDAHRRARRRGRLTWPSADRAALRPGRAATPMDGVQLPGTALAVPSAHVADRVLVPSPRRRRSGGRRRSIPRAPGCGIERARDHQPGGPSPSAPRRTSVVVCDDLLAGGDPDAARAVLAWMLDRAWTGLCALQLGVAEAAVAQTAAYLNTREQFGRPLVDLPGHDAEGRRRGHRHRGDPGHDLAGRLAPRPRPGRRPAR